MNIYFSDIEKTIKEQLVLATQKIIIAVCWFTNENIYNTILET
jgi:hypothetical protein